MLQSRHFTNHFGDCPLRKIFRWRLHLPGTRPSHDKPFLSGSQSAADGASLPQLRYPDHSTTFREVLTLTAGTLSAIRVRKKCCALPLRPGGAKTGPTGMLFAVRMGNRMILRLVLTGMRQDVYGCERKYLNKSGWPMFELEHMGYEFDEVHRIWTRPGYAGIAYNDGDGSERRLADIVREADDIGVFSCELRSKSTDWVALYHLSPQRGNVLRPFENLLKGKVLEIGAGCGAVSRYLGEAGGQVLALEGSPRRAAIAASRTRGLQNVTVLAERFDDFCCGEQFDAITLIGVLEYAGVFSDGHEPALKMLKKARSMLNPNGRLFIAIENQLGLKYFAGVPEDHIGKSMYGIEGRYRNGQPRTYGRHALAKLISAAGFACCEFLAPFPDYKLPQSVLTEQGCAANDFDAAAFAWQSVATDPRQLGPVNFDIARTWRTVFENRLGLELSNSFIAVASQTKQRAVPEQVLAFHYSTGRKAQFCKETCFVRDRPDRLDGSAQCRSADRVRIFADSRPDGAPVRPQYATVHGAGFPLRRRNGFRRFLGSISGRFARRPDGCRPSRRSLCNCVGRSETLHQAAGHIRQKLGGTIVRQAFTTLIRVPSGHPVP